MDSVGGFLLRACWLCGPALALAAQQPPPAGSSPPPSNPPAQQDPQPPAPKPAPVTPRPEDKPAVPPATGQQSQPKPSDQPVDQGAAAAEALRKLLGLKPGPAPDTAVPKGPGDPPPKPPDDQAGKPTEPAAGTTTPAPQDPVPGQQPPSEPTPQDPPAVPPTPRELDAAERALRALLPKAKPPEFAPVPQNPQPAVDPTAAPTPPAHEPSPPAPPQPVFTASSYPVHGSLRTRYRGRSGGGDDDHDLVALLGVDFGDAERHPVTGHTLLRGFVDLDGREADDVFAGLDQSRGDDVDGRIYEAWADLQLTKQLEVLRVGRQPLDETPAPVTFDGIRVDSARLGPMRAWLGGYAGVPVHHFESSASGDDVFGFAGGLQPWRDARLRLDWQRLDDRLLAGDERDDLLGLSWWQRLAGDIGLRGQHTWRNGKPRDLVLHADGDLGDLGLDWQVGWRELLTTQRSEVTELDPFTAIALEQRPFRQFDVTLGKDFGDHVSLGGSATVRRLSDASDEGQFNREFERLSGTVTFRELLAAGVDLTIDGATWNSQGENTRVLAGEVAWQCSEPLRLTAGTAYDLYQYDALADRERVHVRSWFLRADWQPASAVRCDLACTHEQDEDERFWQWRLGVTWTF
ncbi:MAG: hypothetical protein IPK26_18075 [Planctomycetes bacterium]|nr:hypothetical protein [Planctomycetota bacterium]